MNFLSWGLFILIIVVTNIFLFWPAMPDWIWSIILILCGIWSALSWKWESEEE